MFFPLTALSVVGCLVWVRSRDWARSPIKLALYGWAISVLLAVVPLFTFRVAYSLTTDAFVAACLFVTVTGYFLVRKQPLPAPAVYSEPRRESLIAVTLAGLGIVGSVLLLLDARTGGTQLSVNFLLNNLSSIRASNFDRLAEMARPSALAFVGSYLAGCSLLAIIAAVRLGGQRLIALGIGGFFLLAMVSVFVYGGRTTIFVALLLAFVSWYLSGRRMVVLRLRTWVFAAAVFVVVAYFSVAWLDTRQGAGFSPERDLVGIHRAEFHPRIAPLARRNEAVATGLLSASYFASPLPTLTFYLQQKPLPGPFAGGYSYPLPTRMLERVTGAPAKPWIDIRAEVFAPLEGSGYFGNVWSTWLRDLLIDFGYAGTLLFSGLFGSFMAWARNRFERTGGLHYHYLEVIACLTLGFGAFTSYLSFPFLAAAFFTALAVMYATRMRVGKVDASVPGARLPDPGIIGPIQD